MTETVADPHRLDVLAGYRILDTDPEQEFDDIVHLTARLAQTPVALVSLVTDDRQWFKARIGFPRRETGLDSSVCKFVLDEPDLLIIPDLAADPRTCANPLVTGEPGIRFYAGAPIRTADGVTLGSLCAIDTVPRPDGLTDQQKDDLRVLARETMRQLVARRNYREQLESEQRIRALVQIGDRLRDLRDPAEIAYAAAEIMGRTLGAARAGYVSLSGHPSDEIIVEADWCAPGVSSIVGPHTAAFYEPVLDDLRRGAIAITPDTRLDPRTAPTAATFEALNIRGMINVPVIERGELVAIQFAHYDQPHAVSAEVEAFVRNVADRIRAVTARVRVEQQQAIINAEISHRLKNVFAMVQAIAGQTLKRVSDRSAVEAFDQRLRALSSAHDLLLDRELSSSDLMSVLTAVMANIGEHDRWHGEGPRVELGERATLSTSLVFHELATNALKYGALSIPGGTVEVRWRLDDGDAEYFTLSWVERGGPTVEPPNRKGFGSRLLSIGLVGTGGANLSYDSKGFSATFTASLQHARAA